MSAKTFNPYLILQNFFPEGMNAIIDSLPPPPPVPSTEVFFLKPREGH